MLIVSWFWLAGAVVLSLLPALIKDVVGGTEAVVTMCLAIFAIGIAAGSLFAAQLSHVRPNLALVPIGAIVMGIVGLDIAWAIGHATPGADITPLAFITSFDGIRIVADFAIFAFGGGLFVVPSFAAVQAWSAPAERARVIAAGNILQAGFMVVGSLVVALLQAAGLSDRLDLLRPGARVASARSSSFSASGARKACAISARCCFGRCSGSKCEASKISRRRHAHADRA